MDKEELKQRCLNVIEEHQDENHCPGKGSKRRSWALRSSGRKTYGSLLKLGLEPETGVSYTGCRVLGPRNGPRVAVMGEAGLHCIMRLLHPDAASRAEWFMPAGIMQLANMYGAAINILRQASWSTWGRR